jgi:CheY-like chemotaxis protein
MPVPAKTFVLVDPDPHARTLLAWHLSSLGARMLQASSGVEALQMAASQPVSIIVTELYLPTGEDECLIHAVRRDPKFKRTRIVAHTHRSTTADREWAMRAGADAYLIKPTRAQRVRYVIGRLLGNGKGGAGIGPPLTSTAPMTRRDSLDVALLEIEQGGLSDTSTIVFGRAWWSELSTVERKSFRSRARKARVSLRSDSMLSNHFVEVRGLTRDGIGLSTERPESPYRR